MYTEERAFNYSDILSSYNQRKSKISQRSCW